MNFTNQKNIKHKDLDTGQTVSLVGRTILYRIYRWFMIAVSCVFLVWFILPIAIYGIIIPYNIFGIIVSAFVLLFYSFRVFALFIKEAFYSKIVTRIIWKTGKVLVCSFGIYAVVISIIMGICACIPPAQNSSEIMLGAQVRGSSPSLILQDRILAGEKYLNENPESICVATGGLGDSADITEAQCMYNVLTADGISPDRIYLEENATNTKENIQFSYDIIKKNNANENIAIVTDGFHQARARLISIKQGISGNIGAVSSNTNWILLPTYWVREWFGIPYDLIFR